MTAEQRVKSFEKLDKITKKRGISYYKICADLDFARALFSDWKAGRSMPNTEKLLKLGDYLDIDIKIFFED